MVNTTGATLSPAQYRNFYTHFPPRVHLSQFRRRHRFRHLAHRRQTPAGPLRIGEMQIPALGIDVDIADPEIGASMGDTAQHSEILIRKPFPSMPACF